MCHCLLTQFTHILGFIPFRVRSWSYRHTHTDRHTRAHTALQTHYTIQVWWSGRIRPSFGSVEAAVTSQPEQGRNCACARVWEGGQQHSHLINSTHSTPTQDYTHCNHSITPSMNHSINSSMHHSINASLHHSINASLHHSINASFHHSIIPSLHQSINASFHHSTNHYSVRTHKHPLGLTNHQLWLRERQTEQLAIKTVKEKERTENTTHTLNALQHSPACMHTA